MQFHCVAAHLMNFEGEYVPIEKHTVYSIDSQPNYCKENNFSVNLEKLPWQLFNHV